MGYNIGQISSINAQRSMIDAQALERVKEQILNPNKDKTVDVSKLDLSKFNRVNLGTDLYAARTNGETALQASKAATDFDVNLSKAFSANVQYLNSQAAQSLFTSRENNGKVVVGVDNTQPAMGLEAVTASSQVVEPQNMDKDKRGHNPFAFYVNQTNNTNENENNEMFEDLYELNSSIFTPSVDILA